MPDNCGFTPTLNKMGYMSSPDNPICKEFIEAIGCSQLPVVDIGAAYGITSLAALKAGASLVYANDIDPRHLDLLSKNVPLKLKDNLRLLPGQFPEEIDFPENTLGSVLISRVLHFFPGELIETSLKKVYKWLQQL